MADPEEEDEGEGQKIAFDLIQLYAKRREAMGSNVHRTGTAA